MIERYSSRRGGLRDFLPRLLPGALAYDRIAGYFSSSVLEVAGEAIDAMAPGACVRVICNSELQPLDIETARAAHQAMYQEWCRRLPADLPPPLQARLGRLYALLAAGRLSVRVLPDRCFGLVHGKAGVITAADGRRIAFLGSVNESRQAWELNYELAWTDDGAEGVAWVQEEFDALWTSPQAVALADAVITDVQRLSRRVIIPDLPAWQEQEDAAPAATVELPVYRRENGLWAHQQSFISLAFQQHQQRGARLLLADQVGLGKTVQLALAAKLMALWGGGRVLVLAPKSLLQQWQDELWRLLLLPTARWTGRGWQDEQGVLYSGAGVDGLRRCPRRCGLVSSGLLTQSPEAAEALAGLRYECVILDEAHRARRRNLGPTQREERADPNNLLRALRLLATQTRSLLLATATPVQLDPIEAFDLLEALNLGNETVLGTAYSSWLQRPRQGLAYVLGQAPPPAEPADAWEWLRNPLPPADEGIEFARLRRHLDLGDAVYARPEALAALPLPLRHRLQQQTEDFFRQHNPYLRHIVRRTRAFLEQHIDPHTNEPYLQPVRVRLFGEGPEGAVPLPGFLRDAYQAAEQYCAAVAAGSGAGSAFLKTVLLRRLGSTIIAGRKTAQRLLDGPPEAGEDDDDEEPAAPRRLLSPSERGPLEQLLRLLDSAGGRDPKYRKVRRIVLEGVAGSEPWLERGCIIFSQYYDSAHWLAAQLSAELPEETIGLYAAAAGSGLFRAGAFTRLERDNIREAVRHGEVRLLSGTDAASEGLNLQRIGTLINLDLPWNPTRLEQRKGRIQRIGQVRQEVLIYNLRYRDSVEDRVHDLLSARLQAIRDLFGQLPDTLEDVWVAVALQQEEDARRIIDAVPTVHPFELRYERVESLGWETCSAVLDAHCQLAALRQEW